MIRPPVSPTRVLEEPALFLLLMRNCASAPGESRPRVRVPCPQIVYTKAMNMRAYALVTSAYWTFTVTDGALRMLVLLYFHDLGFSPISLALLFVLYELLGVFTNLIGGWIGARFGLHRTLTSGLALQVVALLVLTAVSPAWNQGFAVAWVMGAQALSGVAKDLTKMSAKSAVKVVVAEGSLFRFVALLTGSKNALKGAGFFVGAALLSWLGFRPALLVMAVAVGAALAVVVFRLGDLGRVESKPPLAAVLRKSGSIRRLSLARFFLFGARDIWFVVALPVFLDDVLGWPFPSIGAFLAVWVIGYGAVQASAPRIMAEFRETTLGAYGLLLPMAAIVCIIAVSVQSSQLKALITVAGLLFFGVMFALTSSVHSFLILAYSKSDDDVAMDVGYYYSANAAGRLIGTVLSGVLYTIGGFPAALVGTAVFLIVTLLVSLRLPPAGPHTQRRSHVGVS